ncbi:MAG: MBOAT family protein [Clostridia bacterium]|nr:MBOAT family protein [Clostridia bacterium]MBQ8381859.1 MBOAT family protein [Clostridia bacterium]
MLFNSYVFIFLFLPLTLLLYFGLNKCRQYTLAKLSLVIASLVFYGYNEPYYVLIILSSIGMNYALCCVLQRYPKKAILAGGIIANVILLGYFKYFDFLLENINRFTGSAFDYLNIALPLGISFFTFQQISYLVDTAKGECKQHSFWDYVLFVTFFPQLVAGPIVSHDEMLPQFADMQRKRLNFDNFARGLQAFSIGLFKKVIVADNFGRIVSYGYQNIPTLSSLEAILTILAYTVQIYFDFSGYCDMATGIALMFNIKLPMNFNSPYKAATILEFWKRWHITLTRFLTKYIYIPLGGNRKGKVRTYLNVFLVFLISGIWHGAGYTFILWGVLHGIANILCRLFRKTVDKIPRPINWLMNFVFLNLTWVVFRAPSVGEAWQLIKQVGAGGFGLSVELASSLYQPASIAVMVLVLPLTAVVLVCTAAVLAIAVFGKNTNEIIERSRLSGWTLLTTWALFIVSALSLSGVSTFLYFNF